VDFGTNITVLDFWLLLAERIPTIETTNPKMAAPVLAQEPPPPKDPWDQAEPLCEGAPCYSQVLKADLLPGTFVLLGTSTTSRTASSTTTALSTNSSDATDEGGKTNVVARIVAVVVSSQPPSVCVNIFRYMKEAQKTEGFLCPHLLNENHLRHLTEIVQTTELRIVPTIDIVNLSFVFTMASLQDPSNLFFACQGMVFAFLLRYRFIPNDGGVGSSAREPSLLLDVPCGYCLPFPSRYKNSRYNDCFAHRIWNNVITIKMEMTKLLGRYSQQQGLYGKEHCRLSNVTPETWGFLKQQFGNLVGDSSGCAGLSSSRVRVYRVSESGLVVRAARIKKSCTLLRFETKSHLRQLCKVFGESVTAGQRCRLPKVASPKTLWKNDVINVVCGSDESEPVFNLKTVHDGIDLEFDGSCELFITIRYRRYAYSSNLEGCDPLLASLICRQSLSASTPTSDNDESENHDDNMILSGSEFEDKTDGCLYRVIGIDSSRLVRAKCFYPHRDNNLFGCEKLFDIVLATELIQQRAA
jgi:hypothetical protein